MAASPQPAAEPVAFPLRMPQPPLRRRALRLLVLTALVAAAVWAAWRGYLTLSAPPASAVPTAPVLRGDLRFEVVAQGNLSGGHSEVLTAPMINGAILSVRSLLPSGTLVQPGEVVVQFDTSAQEYNLKQAEEALEQAQQQVIAAQATAAAQNEDDAYQLAKAQFDVERAQLQVRQNPVIDAITAKKNNLTLAAAREHLAQLQHDIASRAASNQASIAVQQAAEAKAASDASTARSNIAAMTLRAAHAGYVAVDANTRNGYDGTSFPLYKAGDVTDPGLAIATIPDTSSWELDATVSELDRGHLAVGQQGEAEFPALPGQGFPVRVATIEGVTGPPWQRQVKIALQLLRANSGLKPGMSAEVRITTSVLRNVLYVPTQAVFGPEGANFVYRESGGHFIRQPVRVTGESESQAALTGVSAGERIALANPEQTAAPAAPPRAAAGAALGGRP